ncbi:PilW family protein [Anaeromyxobacter oryzisoli]|uniref:PilW family protein n=1 Tax=Anaeromyxobacter oryzisoli TaxID=2925408 RepID=UPI001F58B236|nr:prepilin-type N-terminal cleavage/methylation domain-containing protein [Anaeromyxobacter sp. SG63]
MRASHRGFTLVELVVAMAVTVIVLAAAMTVVRAQQKAYHDGEKLRGAQGSGRRALLAMEEALPRAGYGLDASLALDLVPWYGGPCPAELAPCPRDSTTNSDELVFYARDPQYWVDPADNTVAPAGHAWKVTAVSDTTLELAGRAGDVFRKGQIFQLVCPDAKFTYVTSDQKVDPLAADGAVTIQLLSEDTGDPSNPFRRQDVATAPGSCFGGGIARAFLIDRYRFHVRPFPVGGGAGATEYDPFLMLDQGVDRNDDNIVNGADEQVIAEGIELLQVSYIFNGGSTIATAAGENPGTAITFAAAAPSAATTAADTITTTLFPGGAPQPGQSVYGASSFYGYTFGPPPDPVRLTNDQANIQAVHVAVLARSATPDRQGAVGLNPGFRLLNLDTLPAWITGYAAARGGSDGYQRVVLEATVNLPNMANRAMTYF